MKRFLVICQFVFVGLTLIVLPNKTSHGQSVPWFAISDRTAWFEAGALYRTVIDQHVPWPTTMSPTTYGDEIAPGWHIGAGHWLYDDYSASGSGWMIKADEAFVLGTTDVNAEFRVVNGKAAVNMTMLERIGFRSVASAGYSFFGVDDSLSALTPVSVIAGTGMVIEQATFTTTVPAGDTVTLPDGTMFTPTTDTEVEVVTDLPRTVDTTETTSQKDLVAVDNRFHGIDLGWDNNCGVGNLGILTRIGVNLGWMEHTVVRSGQEEVTVTSLDPDFIPTSTSTAGGLFLTSVESLVDSQFTVIPEGNISFDYRVYPGCSFRVGYHLTYFSDIVLAAANATSASTLQRDTLLLHGLNGSINASY